MVFLDHVQNLHIHAEKTHKDSGAHCMNILILYMVEKTHTGPYYRVQALFMCGVHRVHRVHESNELTRAEVETRVRGGGVVEALGAMRRHRSLERGVRGVRR